MIVYEERLRELLCQPMITQLVFIYSIFCTFVGIKFSDFCNFLCKTLDVFNRL